MTLSAKYFLLIATLIILSCNSNPSDKSSKERRYQLEMHNVSYYSYKLNGMRVLKRTITSDHYAAGKILFSNQTITDYEYTVDDSLISEKDYDKKGNGLVLSKSTSHYPDSTIEYNYMDGAIHSFYKEFRYPQGRIKSTETFLVPDIHEIQSFDYSDEKLHRINVFSPSGQQLNTFTFKYETGDEIRREIRRNVNENLDMPETSFYKDNKLYLKTTVIPGATSDSSFYKENRLIKMVSYNATGDKRVEEYKYDEGRIVELSEHYYVPIKQ